MPLEAYKDIVATSAGISTILWYLSGIFICKNILKKRSTRGISAMPFFGGIAMGILMLKYSTILNEAVMARVSVVGLTLNIGYLLCYYIYSHEKGGVVVRLICTALFAGVLLGYSHWESPKLLEYRFGMIITIVMILYMSLPLLSLGDVIRTKSTAMLPFPLILSGTAVNFQWLLYGIIIKNEFIQFQNVVKFTLSIIQLSLFIIYPRSNAEKSKPKTKKN